MIGETNEIRSEWNWLTFEPIAARDTRTMRLIGYFSEDFDYR
jgi:hypothetical protein